ncbi:MAG: hypothetical protein KAJ73_00125 [Zetaproteobacteria bacterium]|nr:hypothetical protein [Zetaproteobacteria bacterium]
MFKEIGDFWITSEFLSYLVNGDGSGLEDYERQTLDHWIEEFDSPVFDVIDQDASFTVCDVTGKGANCYQVKISAHQKENDAEPEPQQEPETVNCYAHPAWMLNPKKDKPDTLGWETVGGSQEPETDSLDLEGCTVARSDEDEDEDEDDQEPNFAAIVADLGLTIDSERISKRPDGLMESGEGVKRAAMDHWRVMLYSDKLETDLTLFYSKGCGHGGAEPELDEVIHCLLMDSDVTEYNGFEEWADCMGYDSDSRQALKIYDACEKQAEEFNSFLQHNGLYFDQLREALQDF